MSSLASMEKSISAFTLAMMVAVAIASFGLCGCEGEKTALPEHCTKSDVQMDTAIQSAIIDSISNFENSAWGSGEADSFNNESDLLRVTTLDVTAGLYERGGNFYSLDGIECVPNLAELTISGRVEVLFRTDSAKSYHRIANALPLLQKLRLTNDAVGNLDGIERLTHLQALDVSDNPALANVSPLQQLDNLVELNLSFDKLTNIGPMAGLKNLQTLSLAGNSISDLIPLSGLVQLQTLDLQGNNITDLSPLLRNSGLGEGDTVSLALNPLDCSDSNVVATVVSLEERGVSLDQTCDCAKLCNGGNCELGVDTLICTDCINGRGGKHCEQILPCDGVVTFNDAAVSTAVKQALGVSSDAAVTADDMSSITDLDIVGAEIWDCTACGSGMQSWYSTGEVQPVTDLEGVQCATNLQTLAISKPALENGAPLADLKRLKRLEIRDIEDNTDFSWVAASHISELTLSGIMTANLSGLSTATSLTKLTTNSPIEGAESLLFLEEIHIAYSDVSISLKWLADLPADGNIALDLSALKVERFAAAFELLVLSPGIKQLNLSNTGIRTIDMLTGVSLTSLDLSGNKEISDLLLLGQMTTLTDLNLQNTNTSDIGFLERLTGLQSLNLHGNHVTDISPLSGLTALANIDLSLNHS